MDTTTQSCMSLSDRYSSIPSAIDSSVASAALNTSKSSDVSVPAVRTTGLKVKKAEPPRFDGKIPSYPRFKKHFTTLMHEYDDSSQVYYMRSSLTSEDRNLIKTLDTMSAVWAVLDKRYKHGEVGANSLSEAFADCKVPPGSDHSQFTTVYLKYN